MSEISINTVKNIDELEQICLLTTCTTKLHVCYRVTLHFGFSPKIPLLLNPLILPSREYALLLSRFRYRKFQKFSSVTQLLKYQKGLNCGKIAKNIAKIWC